jgi:amino acid adenylation domain-containing protein
MPDTQTISEQKRRKLEEYLRARQSSVTVTSGVTRRAPGAVAPLTFAQQQVWLHAQLAPDTPLYNEPFTIHRHGALDVPVLERAFTEIIRRHESWRTTFPLVHGQPIQRVHAAFDVKLPVIDLRNFPPAEREKEALRLAQVDARTPIDLADGPLWRAQLVQLSDEEYRLFINAHHLIFDGVTGYGVLLPELVALYNAFAHGEPSPLPELDYQFADYALWERGDDRQESLKANLEYWRQQLSGAPPALQLPTDHLRPSSPSFRGATQPFTLPTSLTHGLKALSQRENVTLFVTLLAAFNVLLQRYSAQDDIVIGSITAGRKQAGSDKLLGFFLNTIILRNDLAGDPTFRELLARVRQTALEALSHDEVPLNQLVQALHPDRDGSQNPLFRVLLSLEPSLPPVEVGWDLTPIDVETGTTKFDLCLVLDDRCDGLLGRLIYSTDLFDAGTISRMVGHLRTLLEGAVAHPELRISQLPLLTEDERHTLLVRWNDTAKPYPPAFVHEQFEAQVARTPDAIAVRSGERQLTCAELDAKANRLAHYLRAQGVDTHTTVGICTDRSPDMIVAILAVLKSGGAYVPLDPSYPSERLRFMLADSGARVLLTQGHLPDWREGSPCKVVNLDASAPEFESQPATAPDVAPAPESPAYVIYTSGSTGGPKGVLVSHRNLAQSTYARLDYYSEPVSSYLLLSSFAFDSSVAVIFHALCSGATLVLPSRDFNWQSDQIATLVKANQISHLLCIPALYAELLENAVPSSLKSLRTVIVAGEACPTPLVESHYQLLDDTSLFNEYGPSEATVWSTVYACEPGSSTTSVPIGRPIPNAQLYVLDRNLQPIPIGVPGELLIGGDGVALGYLNRRDLTLEKFLANPFSPKPMRIYRTGDLVRYLADGNIEFLGRVDHQVKIRGLRIELGEIEGALVEHPDVKEAAVVTEGSASDLRLIAYVAARQEFSTSAAELRAFLKARVPGYMVPSVFVFVAALPRTPNGKLDRHALPAVISSEDSGKTGPIPPRNATERKLARIWSEVFATEVADVTQDFFELGGHSLLAASLLDGVEKEFGNPLSLAFVFQAPTIELMAETLRRPDESLRSRAIVPIQPKGSRPPLFWIRGGPRFRLLAQKLGPDQPFLGLDLPFWDATRLTAPYRLEDIAAYLVKAMREVQPHSPYALGGLCVNAVLAYEVAQQLRQQGEEIALLAMFDAHNQAFYKNPLKDGRYSGRIKYHLSNLFHSDVKESSAYMLDLLDEARRKIERSVWQLSSNSGKNATGGRPHNTDFVVHPAFHRYEPKPFQGKIALFQSSDWPTGPYFDFKLGWTDLVGDGLEFYRIPGDHPSMFVEPNVNLVASRLSSYLGAESVHRKEVSVASDESKR